MRLLSRLKEGKQSVVSLVDKYMPFIVKVYNPLFLVISIIGFCLMFLGVMPSGFGIPFIFWLFSFVGHVIGFAFTKKIGITSLISCVLCADWLVGSLFNRITADAEIDNVAIVRIVSAVALIGFLVIAMLYVKILNGLKPPVTREYTWDDFKYDYAERQETWNNRMDATKAAFHSAKDKVADLTELLKDKLPRKKKEEPLLLLPAPKNEEYRDPEPLSSSESEINESKEEPLDESFRIIIPHSAEVGEKEFVISSNDQEVEESKSQQLPSEHTSDIESSESYDSAALELLETLGFQEQQIEHNSVPKEPLPKEEPVKPKEQKSEFWKFG